MRIQDLLKGNKSEAKYWRNAVELRGLLLPSIPEQLFCEPYQFKLVTLDISHNRIKALTNIGLLRNLVALCARNNLIDRIPTEVKSLLSLTTLDLAHNNISDIPDDLQDLHELKVINLSANNLEYLPESMIFKCNLERLHVAKNPVQNVPRHILVQGE